MSTLFFAQGPIVDFTSVMKSDTQAYARYFRQMLDLGNFLAPSQFEAIFLSAAHTEADIDATIADNLKALTAMVE